MGGGGAGSEKRHNDVSRSKYNMARGATLKVGGLTSDSKWVGGGDENTFFSVTRYVTLP